MEGLRGKSYKRRLLLGDSFEVTGLESYSKYWNFILLCNEVKKILSFRTDVRNRI